LNEQVKKLLNLDGKEFVLKYKDNEGDLISISTNEELAFAISFSDGALLRLTATVPSDTQQTAFDVTCEFEHPGGPFHGKFPREFGHGHGHGHGHWHGHGHGRGRGGWRGGRGPYERPGCEGGRSKGMSCEKLNAKLAKMTFKCDIIQTQLNEINLSDQPATPDQQRRKEMMQSKLQRLQTKIQRVESQKTGSDVTKMDEGSSTEKKQSKWLSHEEKYQRKCERKSQKQFEKNSKGNVSEEEKAEIKFLKEKIASLKEPLTEIKKAIKAKKQAWRDANEVDGQMISCEIDDLMSKMWEYKKQIRPLRWRIEQICHG